LEIPDIDSSAPETSEPSHTELPAEEDSGKKSLRNVSLLLSTTSQSAQVVKPLESNRAGIRTQTQDQLSIDGVTHQVIPDTVPRGFQSETGLDIDPQVNEGPESTRAEESLDNKSPSRRLFQGPGDSPVFHSQVAFPSIKMESSSVNEPPLSAVEQFRQLHSEVFGTTHTAPPDDSPSQAEQALISPSSVLPLEESQTLASLSAQVDSIPETAWLTSEGASNPSAIAPAENPEASSLQTDIPQLVLPTTDDEDKTRMQIDDEASGTANGLMEPPTIAPSDLTASSAPPNTDLDIVQPSMLDGGDMELADTVLPGIESHQSSVATEADPSVGDAVQPTTATTHEYYVTLPMAANTRQTYMETIRNNRATMVAYGNFFTGVTDSVPDEIITRQMDKLFEVLYDLCDQPTYADSIPAMSAQSMAKHAIGTNCKFLFLHELFDGIRDLDMRILLISKAGRVFDYLEAVILTAGLNYKVLGEDKDIDSEGCLITLADADMDFTTMQGVPDVVILFDCSGRCVDLPPELTHTGVSGPITLSLVVTNSIEHIELQLPDETDDSQKRNVMNFALVESTKVLNDPDRIGFLEPHEVAQQFISFLRDPNEEFTWEPQPIPSSLFDAYTSSQLTQKEENPEETDGVVKHEPTRSSSRKRVLVS
jgi:hypothetical protein